MSPPPRYRTLTRDHGDHAQLVRAVAQAFVAGVPVDWTAVLPGERTARPVPLPTYAFQRRRFWVEPAPRPGSGGNGHDPAETRLWTAIEELDVDALTTTLRLDNDSGAVEDLRPALPILSAWRRRHREQTLLDSWRYRATWTRLPDPSGATSLFGTWLLAVPAEQDEHPAVRATAEALDSRGATALIVPVDTREADRDALAGRLSDLAVETEVEGVLSLLGLDETPHPVHAAVPAGLAATTALIHALGDAGVIAPLWCLTQGAVSVSPADPLPHPVQAQVWGLGRVAALENPQRWGGLIDLPITVDQHTPGRIGALLAPGQPEDQVAIRATGVLARRLEHAPAIGANGANGTAGWRPDGTTLITGGTGDLGAQVARRLAENGAPHLLLTSRSGPDAPGAARLSKELTELGTTVTITACDVSDRGALRDLLDTIPAEHPLTAVFHAAGIPENTAFDDLDLPHMGQVLRPKAQAAAHLHELTRDLDLSAFVLFSSGAAAWGSGLQGSYAAANTYLDALAEHRRALGLPATSIAWGPWGEAGMAADETAVTYFARRGLSPLDPDLAIKSLAPRPRPRRHHRHRRRHRLGEVPRRLHRGAPQPADRRPGHDRSAGRVRAGHRAGRAPTARAARRRHSRPATGHPCSGTSRLTSPPFSVTPTPTPCRPTGRSRSWASTRSPPSNSATSSAPRPASASRRPSSSTTPRRVPWPTSCSSTSSTWTWCPREAFCPSLDKWDSACEPTAVDEAARRRVTSRLELLLAKWSGAGGDDERSAAHRDLETASADDIFDLISDEFGKS